MLTLDNQAIQSTQPKCSEDQVCYLRQIAKLLSRLSLQSTPDSQVIQKNEFAIYSRQQSYLEDWVCNLQQAQIAMLFRRRLGLLMLSRVDSQRAIQKNGFAIYSIQPSYPGDWIYYLQQRAKLFRKLSLLSTVVSQAIQKTDFDIYTIDRKLRCYLKYKSTLSLSC